MNFLSDKMDLGTCSQQQCNALNLKRKRRPARKGLNKHNSTGINDLPDYVLTSILSRLTRKEAARTSVLSRRWRYLRFYSSGTLEFDNTDMFSSDDRALFSSDDDKYVFPFREYELELASRIEPLRKKFIAWVNRVLKFHQHVAINGLVIRFTHLRRRRSLSAPRPTYLDRWIYFAMHKNVKTFELDFSRYGGHDTEFDFPDVDMLLSCSTGVINFGFRSLRSLRLAGVHVKDDLVHYFLASCPYLEHLCIRGSKITRKLRVVDPLPNFKRLEVSDCQRIESLEISAMNLVSCTYQGHVINSPFKQIPNLSELTLGGYFALSFTCEPNKHSSYSVQLVKLALNFVLYPSGMWTPRGVPLFHSLKHLELNIEAEVGESICFFTSFIKASPLLNELRIKISYQLPRPPMLCGFPNVSYRGPHENLKAVKMSGYVGCSSEKKFIKRLLKIGPAIETVTIDTESEYYEKEQWDCVTKSDFFGQTGARTRIEAIQCALKLKSKFPPTTVLIVT